MSAPDLCQCHGCDALVQGVGAAALPLGWNALVNPALGLILFCETCVRRGTMEFHRACHALPRVRRWDVAGVQALYRPVHREVLIVTPDGLAVLTAGEALALRDALSGALAMPALVASLLEEKRT